MGWLGVMGSNPATRGAGEGVGGRGVGAEFFAQDAKARIGGEADLTCSPRMPVTTISIGPWANSSPIRILRRYFKNRCELGCT